MTSPYEGDTFSGRVSRYDVTTGRGHVEVYYLSLSIEEERLPPKDHVLLDTYRFTEEPKTGPALVYSRSLSSVAAQDVLLPENRHENVIKDLAELSESPRNQSADARELDDPEYVRMVWRFTDSAWDRSSGEWIAGRAQVLAAAGAEELILLVRTVSSAMASEKFLAAIKKLGMQPRAPIELEQTFLVRPGLRTPPIYYVEPSRVTEA